MSPAGRRGDTAREQKRARALLEKILASGRVPGAFLFTGEAGLGKKDAALGLAMALNCERPGQGRSGDSDALAGLFGGQGPCAQCPCCRKILSGNHPDVLFVQKTGAFIRIAQVRDLLDTLSMRPAEAKTRVVILSDAGAMNREAQNALLKAVEEPPKNTVFVLLAPEAPILLPTIVSRCQEVRFAPLPAGIVAGLLVAEDKIPREEAEECARLAEGSAGRARALASKGAFRRRQWLSARVQDLAAGPEWERTLGVLALAEILSRDKERLVQDLAWLRLWLRDGLAGLYREKGAGQTAWAPGAGPLDLVEKIRALDVCEQDLARNVNARLACEALLFALAA